MKIGMVSLGCPKNLVDSEVMLGLAQEEGHQLTRDAAEADVLIVNTCAFIDKAKQESIDTILEMAEHKKTGACRRLVVTGCMAERYRDELREQIPEIDAVLGTGEVPEIVMTAGRCIAQGGLIPRFRSNGERRPICSPAEHGVTDCPNPAEPGPTREVLDFGEWDRTGGGGPPAGRPTSTTRTRHGCWRRRATTPTSRSPKAVTTSAPSASSRRCAESIAAAPIDSVVPEAERLAAPGVKELLLISQDTTFYGIDQGERGRWHGCSARSIASRVSNGFGCSTSTPPRSPTTCSRRWRRARRCAATSTCRCSTPRTGC